MKSCVALLCAAICLCAQLEALADEVPTLDVTKSCRVDVRAYDGQATAAVCVADEQRARQTLLRQWASFSQESRTTCRQMVTDIAGLPSYVELLTCLETAKISSSLPKN